MMQLFLYLVFLACVGITAAWIAENPGNVTMLWFDYRIDTSFAFVLVLTALAALVLAVVYVLVHRLLRAPDFFSRHRSARSYEKGLAELTHGLVALAAADTKAAEQHTRKAEKQLGRTPLTLLLSAQVARSQGNDELTQKLLEQMLEHKETEYLAARYLSESASKRQQLPAARDMALRAHKLNPQGITPLLSLHIRLREWQHAFVALQKALRKGQIARNRLHHYKGTIYAQQALDLLHHQQDEAALAAARHAVKEQPENLAVLQLAARAYIANQQQALAIKLLMSAWKKQPHTLLAQSFRLAIEREPKEKQLKLTKKLAALQPTAYASHLLLAQAYSLQGQWAEARTEAKKALALQETAQICKLMAEIELGEFSDYDAHGRWLARSARAIPEGSWVCSSCSQSSPAWDAHCPQCHNFDTLEWKQRELTFVN